MCSSEKLDVACTPLDCRRKSRVARWSDKYNTKQRPRGCVLMEGVEIVLPITNISVPLLNPHGAILHEQIHVQPDTRTWTDTHLLCDRPTTSSIPSSIVFHHLDLDHRRAKVHVYAHSISPSVQENIETRRASGRATAISHTGEGYATRSLLRRLSASPSNYHIDPATPFEHIGVFTRSEAQLTVVLTSSIDRSRTS
jgi:hypothetical protein